MPTITGIHHVSLTVTDLARSVAWYTDVLGFAVDADVEGDTFRRTRLRHPDAPLVLTLTRHSAGTSEPFAETRPGLDHLALQAPGLTDVEEWQRHLDERGVAHSPIKRRSGEVAIITLRDPDNIQLEIFALRQEQGR